MGTGCREGGPRVAHIDLQFNKSSIGPNAFALPGGTAVMTDEMVKLADGHEDMVAGVLAHEAAHVQHRHGMRMLVQATLLGTVTSIAFGDFSSLFCRGPALLGHLAYSARPRARGRRRGQFSVAGQRHPAVGDGHDVRAAARPPARGGMPSLPIALGSHPPDDERIARFRERSRRTLNASIRPCAEPARVDHGLRERLGRFLRQVVADAAGRGCGARTGRRTSLA